MGVVSYISDSHEESNNIRRQKLMDRIVLNGEQPLLSEFPIRIDYYAEWQQEGNWQVSIRKKRKPVRSGAVFL